MKTVLSWWIILHGEISSISFSLLLISLIIGGLYTSKTSGHLKDLVVFLWNQLPRTRNAMPRVPSISWRLVPKMDIKIRKLNYSFHCLNLMEERDKLTRIPNTTSSHSLQDSSVCVLLYLNSGTMKKNWLSIKDQSNNLFLKFIMRSQLDFISKKARNTRLFALPRCLARLVISDCPFISMKSCVILICIVLLILSTSIVLSLSSTKRTTPRSRTGRESSSRIVFNTWSMKMTSHWARKRLFKKRERISISVLKIQMMMLLTQKTMLLVTRMMTTRSMITLNENEIKSSVRKILTN